MSEKSERSTDESLTALCAPDEAIRTLEMGEKAPEVSDLFFFRRQNRYLLTLDFFNLKLDHQMDQKVQEMVSAINTATTAGLRPLLAQYTVELDQTKLNELMKNPTREAIMASELTAHDVMKAIIVCVGFRRLTQSKFIENDEVRKIHKWFEDLSHGDQ